jgi:hypothetical protein
MHTAESGTAQPESRSVDGNGEGSTLMPDPVNRRDNPALDEFYGDNPTGPSAGEVKDAQQPMREMKDVATAVFVEAGTHLLTDSAFELAEKLAESIGCAALSTAARGASIVSSAIAGTLTAFELAIVKPSERGQVLSQAYASDQARFAAVLMAQVADPTLLPAGYAESLKGAMVGSGSFFNSTAVIMATRMQTDIAKGDAAAIAFRDHLLASMRSGVDAALAYHIDSQAALDQRSERDPAFRNRYGLDAGFQIGVRAAIWQANIFPDDFVKAERDRGLQTTTIQLAQGV